MWITFFAVTIAMAIGFTVSAIVIESREDGAASVG
jgi:hypothetical protein